MKGEPIKSISHGSKAKGKNYYSLETKELVAASYMLSLEIGELLEL